MKKSLKGPTIRKEPWRGVGKATKRLKRLANRRARKGKDCTRLIGE